MKRIDKSIIKVPKNTKYEEKGMDRWIYDLIMIHLGLIK